MKCDRVSAIENFRREIEKFSEMLKGFTGPDEVREANEKMLRQAKRDLELIKEREFCCQCGQMRF